MNNDTFQGKSEPVKSPKMVYHVICQLIKYKENNPYKDWIVTYSDSTFDKLAKSLEELIDQKSNHSKFDDLNVFYEKAMQLELEFFDAYSDF